jgi:anti-anti-sigma factor
MTPSKDSKGTFQIYQTGELTVVGFGGCEVLDQIDLSLCRSEIVKVVEEHKCQTLAFDLSGVKLIPSGMLGLLASLRKMNIAVHLYNPSPDVVEVLQITRLADAMPIHFIDLNPSGAKVQSQSNVDVSSGASGESPPAAT